MSSYKDHFGSVLKTEDLLGKGNVRVVIESVGSEEVKNDTGKEKKLVARFAKRDKGLVLNRTNADALAGITGTDDFEQWAGTPVILYVDATVQFGGKRVGGIRLRGATPLPHVEPPQPIAVGPEAPPIEPADDEDSIPF